VAIFVAGDETNLVITCKAHTREANSKSEYARYDVVSDFDYRLYYDYSMSACCDVELPINWA